MGGDILTLILAVFVIVAGLLVASSGFWLGLNQTQRNIGAVIIGIAVVIAGFILIGLALW